MQNDVSLCCRSCGFHFQIKFLMSYDAFYLVTVVVPIFRSNFSCHKMCHYVATVVVLISRSNFRAI